MNKRIEDSITKLEQIKKDCYELVESDFSFINNKELLEMCQESYFQRIINKMI